MRLIRFNCSANLPPHHLTKKMSDFDINSTGESVGKVFSDRIQGKTGEWVFQALRI
jgi:hypothetical protein